eukprot:2707710-Lingulodinium_polyedra.AAC.1
MFLVAMLRRPLAATEQKQPVVTVVAMPGWPLAAQKHKLRSTHFVSRTGLQVSRRKQWSVG